MLHLARSWLNQSKLAPDRRLALAAVATSPHELLEALSRARSALTASPDRPLDGRRGVFYNPAPLGRTGQLAFVFPGSGNHYPNMGQAIALRWPEIARALDRESQHLRSQFVEGQLHGGNSADTDIHRSIFRQVSYCVMMSDLLRRLGLSPQAVIGYSLGESAGLLPFAPGRTATKCSAA
jgi:acyl transferase domain-containing protein